MSAAIHIMYDVTMTVIIIMSTAIHIMDDGTMAAIYVCG